MTDFEKVVDFNLNFGVLSSSVLVPKPDIFNTDPNQVEFCMKLIREEMKELEQAVKEKDYIETVDALADILYVVHGMSARIGVSMDNAFNLVHENNMSKLCKTEEEAKESVEYYIRNKEKLGYDSPAYRKATDNIHWVVYNQSTKKVLKSINWKPVDLTSVCIP
ncbi:phosphoribosyl-ATP pyrophosphohydrolase [Indivirus ILV1]|uniref:Phosphoribosyl-ATP pyrophosphohydrolase n=1 Tax=Indivirus ILV1 TaxID=1977633 RepID=A0A1V0SD17_9VIRU|nr:phosphoribosyl-ATP pyrophosphohydrolase [Indivirus ILV1]